MVTRLPAHPCPFCGHRLNAAGDPTDDSAVPTSGDVTVCIKCAEVLFYDTDMTLRRPRPGEMILMLANDPAWAGDIVRMQQMIRSLPK
jgi:hypothetical protein